MNLKVIFPALSLILISCSTDNETPQDSDSNLDKLISSYYLDDGNNVDSLFYENRKLKTVKEYVGGRVDSPPGLDYIISYDYNETEQLIEITRRHSSSSVSERTLTYDYNDNGTLKSRTSTNGSFEFETTFSYREGLIVLNEGTDSERRIHLNGLDQPERVEEYGGEIDGFFTVKTYFYDENNNISKIVITDRDEQVVFQYDIEYDDKPNPFQVFDSPLPNGLSIRTIEDAEQNFGNYHEIPYSFSIENPWGYFNKNNLVSCKVSGAENFDYKYEYEYDGDGFPSKVKFQFWSNPNLQVTYK